MFLVAVYNCGYAMPEAQRKFAEDLRQGCADTFKREQFAVCIIEGEMRPEDPTFVAAEGYTTRLGPALLASTLEKKVLELHQASGLNRKVFVKVRACDKDMDYPR